MAHPDPTDPTDPAWAEIARRMERALRRHPVPGPPPGFADRVTARVLADRPRTIRLWPWLAAAAACLVAAVALARPWSIDGPLGRFVARKPAPTPVPLPEPTPSPATPPLRNSLTEAGEAVASLTRRTAKEATEPARLIKSTKADATKVEPPTAPDAQALSEVGHTVAEGFEPVTHSAKRAFSVFLRDFTPSGPRKPDL